MEIDLSRLERASRELAKAIADANRDNKGQLLPVRQLARAADVSVVTMNKAIRPFVKQGKIIPVHGLGLFLPGATGLKLRDEQEHHVSAVRTDRGWIRVYNRFIHDLRHGTYEPGTVLPSRKELCYKFGVSPCTVYKAMHRLCEERRIEPWRRTYRIPPVSSANFRTSIAVVIPGFRSLDNKPFINTSDINISAYPRMSDNLAALEQECICRGLRLLTVIRDYKDNTWYSNGQRIRLDKKFVRHHSLAGCIVIDIGINTRDLAQTCGPLDTLGIPVTVLEEGSNDQFLRQMFPSFAILEMGTTSRSGYLAGDYLLQAGHHTIAYIAPSHLLEGLYWSQLRLEGLQTAVHQSPINARVIPFTGSTSHLFDLHFRFQAFYEDTALPAMDSAFKDSNEYAQAFLQTIHLRQQEICRMIVREDLYGKMVPLLEQALDNHSISIWVCQNDLVALTAIRFLEEHRIAVPGRISVMGFDNSTEARTNCLTSYSFNPIQTARVLVGFILKNPDYLEQFRKECPIELDGVIMERNTVRRLAGKIHQVNQP